MHLTSTVKDGLEDSFEDVQEAAMSILRKLAPEDNASIGDKADWHDCESIHVGRRRQTGYAGR